MHATRSADGTTLMFDRIGTGPAVVLVEGALNALTTTLPVAALLQDRFSAFAYDRRGRGGSGDSGTCSVEREIEDLAAVVAEAGGSAAVFANCSGSALALRAAAEGVGITALALYEPPFLTDGLHSLPPGYTEDLARCIAEGRRGDALELFMRGAVQLPAAHVDAVRSGPMWAQLEELAPTLLHDHAAMGDYSLPTDLLADVAVPTLVIEGDQSPDWARNSAGKLVEALPRAELHTLRGHSHLLVPTAVAPVVGDFLDRAA